MEAELFKAQVVLNETLAALAISEAKLDEAKAVLQVDSAKNQVFSLLHFLSFYFISFLLTRPKPKSCELNIALPGRISSRFCFKSMVI